MADDVSDAKTALVTGAAGFVGRFAVRALEDAGFVVRSLVGPPQLGSFAPGGDGRAEADICDGEAVAEMAAGAEVVVHLAGPPSVADSFVHAREYARVHVEGTVSVLEACRLADVSRLVYISSAEVYGRPETELVREDHPLRARSPYAAAKIGAEAMVTAYAASFGLKATILRPFSIYGPGASPKSLIGEVIGKICAGEPVMVRDLRPVRDYCFVGDVAAAIVAACRCEDEGLRIFNVGSMCGSSVAEVCSLVLNVLGSDTLIGEVGGRRPGSSEILRLVSDSRRARESLGWLPEVSLEEGLRITVGAGQR